MLRQQSWLRGAASLQLCGYETAPWQDVSDFDLTMKLGIGVGVIAYLVIWLMNLGITKILYEEGMTSEDILEKWYYFLLSWPTYLLLVIPAFVGGYIATEKGLVVGFFVGFLGVIITFLIGYLISSWSIGPLMPTLNEFLEFRLNNAIQAGFVASFSGVAGEYIVTNKNSNNGRQSRRLN